MRKTQKSVSPSGNRRFEDPRAASFHGFLNGQTALREDWVHPALKRPLKGRAQDAHCKPGGGYSSEIFFKLSWMAADRKYQTPAELISSLYPGTHSGDSVTTHSILFLFKAGGRGPPTPALFQVLIQFRFQGGSVKVRTASANSARMGVAVRVWVP